MGLSGEITLAHGTDIPPRCMSVPPSGLSDPAQTSQALGATACRRLRSPAMRRSSAAWVVCALLLGGCGRSSSGPGATAKQITVPAYNAYPAITIPVTSATSARCRHEAEAFSRQAVAFLAPYPSDSDTHWVIARLQFLEFKAHRCDLAILRREFSRQATRKQRQAIVARSEFSFLKETGRELTAP